jgi:hypothetical protein
MMISGLSVQTVVFIPSLNDESYSNLRSRLFIDVYSVAGYSSTHEACIFNFSANTPNNEFNTTVSVVVNQPQAPKRNSVIGSL